MRAILKDGLAILVAETDEEKTALEDWSEAADDHVYRVRRQGTGGVELHDLGPYEAINAAPINVSSIMPRKDWRPIGNFAATPFVLDGETYASTEGFWQSLKYPEGPERRRVARLAGREAKRAGDAAAQSETFDYRGQTIRVGRPEHWALMRRACEAKFAQHAAARAALLSTGERPLAHRLRTDSKTIPGVIMAEIWMAIRAKLRAG